MSDTPPRRLWREIGPDADGDRPDPLQRKGDFVSTRMLISGQLPLIYKAMHLPPLILSALEPNKHASRNKLADDPAEVDVTGEVVPQGYGTDLGRVGHCHGLEDAPRHALE